MIRTRIHTVIATIAIVTLGVAPAAWAQSGMPSGHESMMPQGHPGGMMEGGHRGMMQGGKPGGHHGKMGHRFGPHNAAEHFLMMTDKLELTDAQIRKITTLRDLWVEEQATNEARLQAAEKDLKRLIFAADMDLPAIEKLLTTIGQLEAPLWRAFVHQLAEIKGLLSKKQKKALEEMKQRRHGMMMGGGPR